MHARCLILIAMLTAVLAAWQDAAAPAVRVTGAVKQPLTLTVADMLQIPRSTVKTQGNGIEILGKAGATLGSELRGKALSSYVLAHAQDGYEALFSLAGLDPSFTESEVLRADTANGSRCSAHSAAFASLHRRTGRAPDLCGCSPKSRLCK